MANDAAGARTQGRPGDADAIDRISAAWRAAEPRYPLDTVEIFGRIAHLARHVNLSLAEIAKDNGIAAGDLRLLLVLRRAQSTVTPTALFRELAVTAGAVSKSVDRLVARGFVRRTAHGSDARSVRVGLTARGKRVVDRDVIFSAEFALRSVYELSDRDRDALRTLLSKLLVIMERAER